MLPVHQSERPDQSNRNSPIHLAAARGNVEAVRILMESNVTKNKEPINKRYTTRINIQTFLVVLTNWMKVLIFIHRKRLGLYQNDFGIDVLKFSTYVPRFCTTFN